MQFLVLLLQPFQLLLQDVILEALMQRQGGFVFSQPVEEKEGYKREQQQRWKKEELCIRLADPLN